MCVQAIAAPGMCVRTAAHGIADGSWRLAAERSRRGNFARIRLSMTGIGISPDRWCLVAVGFVRKSVLTQDNWPI